MNLNNVHGEKKDFLKALTKPATKLIIQLDKKILEKIALGKTEYSEKSLIKVRLRFHPTIVHYFCRSSLGMIEIQQNFS